MTYTFPPSLHPLRDHLRGLGADTNSFVSARQAAFMAQQLLNTRVKFPPQGQDMISTLFLIQKAVTEKGVGTPSPSGRTPAGNKRQAPAPKAPKGDRSAAKIAKEYPVCDATTGIHIFCDGAAVPNPGVGGWGVVVYRDGNTVGEWFGGEPETTNNQMELTALLNAIARAEHLIREYGQPVTIWSDSQYCVEGANTWMPTWKARGWSKRKLNSPKRAEGEIKNLDLWQAIDAAMTGRDRAQIAIKWVKGHAGIVGNERADELAEMGRQEAVENAPVLGAPADDLDTQYRQIMGVM